MGIRNKNGDLTVKALRDGYIEQRAAEGKWGRAVIELTVVEDDFIVVHREWRRDGLLAFRNVHRTPSADKAREKFKALVRAAERPSDPNRLD